MQHPVLQGINSEGSYLQELKTLSFINWDRMIHPSAVSSLYPREPLLSLFGHCHCWQSQLHSLRTSLSLSWNFVPLLPIVYLSWTREHIAKNAYSQHYSCLLQRPQALARLIAAWFQNTTSPMGLTSCSSIVIIRGLEVLQKLANCVLLYQIIYILNKIVKDKENYHDVIKASVQ